MLRFILLLPTANLPLPRLMAAKPGGKDFWKIATKIHLQQDLEGPG